MKIVLNGISGRHPAAKADGPAALRDLSLIVQTGEQVAVIGPSGAGKTTLLHLLACALKPAAGSLQLDEIDPWTLSQSALQAQRGRMFLAPQVPPLPPRQRVVTAVLAGRLPNESLWASLRSLFYPVDMALAQAALAEFDLSEKLFERVDRLSGGERQRVGLARALVAPAELWLIDEPLSALDPTRANQAMVTLVAGARERGVTLVATLHQVDMALAHFSRIVGLRDGELAFDLPAEQVTPERLAKLYESYENELRGEAAVAAVDIAPAPPQPAVMHCR